MPFETGSNDLVGLDGGDFDRDEVRTNGLNFQKLKTQNFAGTIEYDFGPVTLYSVTSYWHGKLESRGDIDRLATTHGPGFIPFQAQSQDNIPDLDQFTQEIRIASNNSDGLGYQAGVFYFNEDLDIESFDFFAPTATDPSAIVNQHQDSKAWGIFGSVNYAFDNGLKLQAGARWNSDDKKLVAEREFDLRPGFIGGGPVPEKTIEADDSVLTWDVSAIHEINQDINVYARIAKGYRAPSLQGRILFDRDPSIADSETTMSYEAGIKTVLFDRRLRFNLTGYYLQDQGPAAVGGRRRAPTPTCCLTPMR